MHLDLSKVQNLLKSGQLRICVVGIGRIGLPTALSFANSNLPTIGVDINENLVNMINSENFPLKDEPGYSEIFHKKFIDNYNLKENIKIKVIKSFKNLNTKISQTSVTSILVFGLIIKPHPFNILIGTIFCITALTLVITINFSLTLLFANWYSALIR